jgi:hypothetical protein
MPCLTIKKVKLALLITLAVTAELILSQMEKYRLIKPQLLKMEKFVQEFQNYREETQK